MTQPQHIYLQLPAKETRMESMRQHLKRERQKVRTLQEEKNRLQQKYDSLKQSIKTQNV